MRKNTELITAEVGEKYNISGKNYRMIAMKMTVVLHVEHMRKIITKKEKNFLVFCLKFVHHFLKINFFFKFLLTSVMMVLVLNQAEAQKSIVIFPFSSS